MVASLGTETLSSLADPMGSDQCENENLSIQWSQLSKACGCMGEGWGQRGEKNGAGGRGD